MSPLTLIAFTLNQILVPFIVVIVLGALIYLVSRKIYTLKIARNILIVFLIISAFVVWRQVVPQKINGLGPAAGPVIPFKHIIQFFLKSSSMEKVSDIAPNPGNLPSPIERRTEDQVKIELTTKEVIAQMADGITLNYWTFNGTVPGPFLRVREGDTVELTLKNDTTSINDHNIDLHAVTGPGGGATVTNVKPGESKTFSFKALNPGLYVYHCAHPNVATHMAHGMYGLILVEPKEGLPPVDHEFFVVQGEFYSTGPVGQKGLQVFDAQKMLDSKPEYIVFNGRSNGAVGQMSVKTGDKVRLYVGNGGVNLISSFHIIGEIFDRVYPEAAIGETSAILENVQTTIVPAGGAAIVEFTVQVPGKYILVDHALSRLDRGAWGTINVSGPNDTAIFNGISDLNSSGH